MARARFPFHRLAALASLALCLLSSASVFAAEAFLRVNQVGYIASKSKRAFLLASGSEAGATFELRNTSGKVVFSAPIGESTGAWSASFPNVYKLDFGSFETPGRYTIAVHGPIEARSPSFRIDDAADLYSSLIANARFFFAAQRDGADVIGSRMSRQPSPPNGRKAT